MSIGLTLKLLKRSEVIHRSWDEVDIQIAKQFGTFFCQRVFSELISQQKGEESTWFQEGWRCWWLSPEAELVAVKPEASFMSQRRRGWAS